MPVGRPYRTGASRRSPGTRFEREFGSDDAPDFGPRSPKRRKKPSRPTKRTAKRKRSRDFEEGRRFERQRVAAALQPPRESGYDERDRDHGGRRIGWRV